MLSLLCSYVQVLSSIVAVLFPGVSLRGGSGESICEGGETHIFCIFRSGLEEMTTDGVSFTLSSIITQNIFCSFVRPALLPPFN